MLFWFFHQKKVQMANKCEKMLNITNHLREGGKINFKIVATLSFMIICCGKFLINNLS